MAKKSVPNRQHTHIKRENKFIDMPKDKLIKILVAVGVVILAVVLFFVLRNAFDGHLPVEDGVVVTEADNWIVGNTGSATSPRYFKLGVAGEADGFTMTTPEKKTEAGALALDYTADDAANPIQTAHITAYSIKYDQLGQQLHANYASQLPGIVISELDQADVAGHPARSFSFTFNYPQTNPENGELLETSDYVSSYCTVVEGPRGQSILVRSQSKMTSAEACASADALKAVCDQLIASMTLDK